MNRPLIRMRGVSRRFPPATIAVTDASFDVFPGESVSIVGASGSGKSTLLAIIGLLDRPSGGEYLLEGSDVGSMRAGAISRMRRDMIGYVFQSFHLIDYLTVRENILHALAIKGVHGRPAHDRAMECLERAGLEDKAEQFPSTLSGGEQQRTAIARAIAARPKLLLCDEPTGNLDSRNSQTVVNMLATVIGKDTTLIIVTHDPRVADSCARHLMVSDGVVSEEG